VQAEAYQEAASQGARQGAKGGMMLASLRREVANRPDAGIAATCNSEAPRIIYAMSESTTMGDSPAPLAEPGAASSTPEPPPEQSPVAGDRSTRFVAPGAVLRAAAARRAPAEYLRRSSPQI
jgi:hypothetical protein